MRKFFLFTVPHEDERCCRFEGKEGRVNREWDKQFTQLRVYTREKGVGMPGGDGEISQ